MGEIRRRQFLIASGALLVAHCSVHAQPLGKVLRVGTIAVSATPAELSDATAPSRRAYEQLMRERGYIEGRNLVTERRTVEGKLERIPKFADEFVRLKTDVIVVPHVSVGKTVAKVATNTPIFSVAGDPILWEVAQSLNRPGGNINGIFAAGTITVEQKRLQLLRELVPNLRRVAFVANREWWDGAWGKSLREASSQLGLQFVYVESTASGFGDAFAVLKRDKPDAAYFESSPAAFNLRASIGDFAVSSRIPSACGHQEVVEAGCLMTYNFTTAETYRAMVEFIDRIAKGAKASELPYQQYTRYEFAVNARTARAIGLVIPQSLLLSADRVIE